MPKTSKHTASHIEDMGVMEGRHEDLYEAGDAYYAPPGHTPAVLAGTELIEFSPTEEYGRTMEVVGRNLAVMQQV